MNKARRKELDEVIALIGGIDLNNIAQYLTDYQAEEQDKFDNLSEGLQASEQGQTIEAAADALQEALDAIEEATQLLDEATTQIEAAQE